MRCAEPRSRFPGLPSPPRIPALGLTSSALDLLLALLCRADVSPVERSGFRWGASTVRLGDGGVQATSGPREPAKTRGKAPRLNPRRPRVSAEKEARVLKHLNQVGPLQVGGRGRRRAR